MASQARTNIWIDGSQAGSTLKELKKNVYALNREIEALPRNSDKYKQKVEELSQANAALKNHRDQIRGVNGSYKQANTGLGSMIKQFAPLAGAVAIGGKVISGITSAVSSWYENNIKLEKSLSSLKSLTGASAEDLEFYKEEAIQMGKTTTLSATQVVDAFKLIGSNKPELLKNKEALAETTKEVITLAEAAEMDLGASAQALTGALNQFGKGADEASRFTNALAAGSQAGASDIQSLSDSLDKSGSVMAGYNIEIEQGIGLLETMGEKNIKGAEAGTKLRNVLLTMQSIKALPPEAIGQLESFGVNIDVVADKTQPLNVRLEEMAKISGDATAMTKVFGKENQVAAAAILNNTEKVQEYTEAVTGTYTAYEQARINTNNLDGDIKALGSAWEGLTLSFSGSESVFRPVVQAGTDMLNWLSDSITAVKNWDVRSMDTQTLKLAKAFTFFNPQLEEYYDRQIKINEIASEVVDAIKDESKAMSVAIQTIDQNNQKLKDANITEEEAADLKQQNAEFIDALNEKYPELTAQMDLNAASSEELNTLQKQINQNLVEQAVNAAMAREAERLLDEIVQQTIKSAQLRREEQKRQGQYTQWELAQIALGFKETSAQSEEASKKAQKDLKELGSVSQAVMNDLKDTDLDFGAGFKENSDMASDALKELERLTQELANTTDVSQKAILSSQIKAQKSIINSSKKNMTEAQQAALALLSKQSDAEVEAAEASIEAQKQQKKAAEEARKEYEKLLDKLKEIVEKSKEWQDDFDYKKRLDAFKEGQEKELFELEHSLNEKYAKEIAAAEELSKQKGELGVKAQEELNALLILKQEELEYERGLIIDKYTTQQTQARLDAEKEANLRFLQQQQTLEESIVQLKVDKATIAANAVSEVDLAARRKAYQELEQALIEQAELEKTRKIEALMDQEAAMEITREEFNNRKEMVELEHMQRVEGIHNEATDRITQNAEQRFDDMVGNISTVVDAINDLYIASLDKQKKKLDKQEKDELKTLQEKLDKKLISEDEFNAKKAEIEAGYDEQRKQVERKKAQAEKEAALFKAFIDTASAIVEAAPNLALMGIATLVGATQIAAIESRPLPQFAEGGFHNVIGANDGKMYNAKFVGRPKAGLTPSTPSLALMSEEGPEYFVPNSLLGHPLVANYVGAIEAIRTNQFAEGGFTSSGATGSGGDELLTWISKNTQMMELLVQILPNIRVNVDDGSIDQMTDIQNELNALRA